MTETARMHESGRQRRAVQKKAGEGQVTDRRAARTRRELHRALFSLLEKRTYEAITVVEICEQADVGRSAFYEHFRGKDDLFRVGFAQLEKELSTALSASCATDVARDRRIVVHALFSHAAGHARLYRAIARGHAGRVADVTIANILSPYLLPLLGDGGETPSVVLDLRLRTTLGALLAALHWWLERGARLDIDTLVGEVMSMFARPAAGS